MKKSNKTLWAIVKSAGIVLVYCGLFAIGYKIGYKLGEIIF